MKQRRFNCLTLAIAGVVGLSGQAIAGATDTAAEAALFNRSLSSILTLQNAEAKMKSGDPWIEVNLLSENHHDASFSFEPETPWDFSNKETVALALDIENPLDSSVHAYIYTHDANGVFQLRSRVIPANSKDSYLMELKVPALELDSGIRSDPPSWSHDYVETIWRTGSKELDMSAISKVRVMISGVLEDKTLRVSNLRLVEPKDFDPEYLVGLVDKFGQNAKVDFPYKINSMEHLLEVSAKEQAELIDQPIASRSKFNGWADGPKLEATGYYRVEKYKGQWTMVDPEGYLFWSNGIANIRMSNTSTVTGYDFDPKKIYQRAADDNTPEDSEGLNRVPEKAWGTRFVSSPMRANMFTWLPEYDSPEADSYGYRRLVHKGPVKQGETYSFYRENLSRKFDHKGEEDLMAQWRDKTIKRMHTWGFTSFGNWVDPEFYQMDRLPYFANGWVIGDFKTVSSGNDHWGPMPDTFDPLFVERVDATVRQVAAEVQDNPWCVGVFIDNEKSWGADWSVQGRYGIVINGFALDAKDSPLKAQMVSSLKKKYPQLSAFNKAWDLELASWKALERPLEVTNLSPAVVADLADLTVEYAEAYFKAVREAMDRHMPNHMYLGPRFAHWAMTPETLQAAAKYVDVMSYNYYREGLDQPYWAFLEDIDMPSIIGEFHNGSMDSGLLNPGLIMAESQADRGKKYQEYVNSAIDNPYFVGTHWFQYIDSPLTGRAWDGENYNVGFVSVADVPYGPLIDAAKELNSQIYTRRFQAQ
ncbi:agarase [Vibrio sp. WXL210]|uniref:agarase n=1 Tax=Vibrio sp. WXL210 TaxID=3450709 RepID=UPI003EC617BE